MWLPCRQESPRALRGEKVDMREEEADMREEELDISHRKLEGPS